MPKHMTNDIKITDVHVRNRVVLIFRSVLPVYGNSRKIAFFIDENAPEARVVHCVSFAVKVERHFTSMTIYCSEPGGAGGFRVRIIQRIRGVDHETVRIRLSLRSSWHLTRLRRNGDARIATIRMT